MTYDNHRNTDASRYLPKYATLLGSIMVDINDGPEVRAQLRRGLDAMDPVVLVLPNGVEEVVVSVRTGDDGYLVPTDDATMLAVLRAKYATLECWGWQEAGEDAARPTTSNSGR